MRRGREWARGGLALALLATPVLAQSTFDTSLTQAQANTLLYKTCDHERGRLQGMVSAAEWSHIMAEANSVLLGNVGTARLNALLDKTSRGTSQVDQAAGEFQYCLIMGKITYAEAREKRAQR